MYFVQCKVCFKPIVWLVYIPEKYGEGGSNNNKKRSCRREKPEMSLVFFVLFQNTFKIEVFVPDLVKNVSSKMNKKDRKILCPRSYI